LTLSIAFIIGNTKLRGAMDQYATRSHVLGYQCSFDHRSHPDPTRNANTEPLRTKQYEPAPISRPLTRLGEFAAGSYRIVRAWTLLSALPFPPAAPPTPAAPAFFSKIFQNLRLSSAAAVASVWPSGLRQLCSTLLSWAGISTFLTSDG